MRTPIVHASAPVTLVGGGELGPDDLKLALARAATLVAADGGADAALRAGRDPVAVIGDLDSLTPGARARIPPERLHRITDQDRTDFDKALGAIEAPLVLAVGFLGGRVDHQLAALNTLARQVGRRCILIGAQEVVFHLSGRVEVDLQAGDVVSLFAMRSVGGRSEGLEWPIGGLEFAPGGRIGTSNRALGPVVVQMDGPGMLMIAPKCRLDAVMRAIGPAGVSPSGGAGPACG